MKIDLVKALKASSVPLFWYAAHGINYPRAQASRVIGERAKRARRYLVMFMETRDIYMYICTSVSNTHARVSVLRIKFKSKETEDFLA